MNERSLILLDLDNTLIHTTTDVPHPDFELLPHPTLYIHVRPYVREFLSYLMQNDSLFEFGFWTCGSYEYAHDVVRELLKLVNAPDWPLRILMTRRDAIIVNGAYVKDLQLVKELYGVTDLLLLDDNPIHFAIPDNKSQICLVPSFAVTNVGAVHDSFLMHLTHLSALRPPSPPPSPLLHRPRAVRPSSLVVVPAPW